MNYFNTNKNFLDCQLCKLSDKHSEVGSCQKKDDHLIETKINDRQKNQDVLKIDEKFEKEQRDKKAFVVQIDDAQDVDILNNLLQDPINSYESSDIVLLNTQN